MPSRQINDFSQKGNRKKVNLWPDLKDIANRRWFCQFNEDEQAVMPAMFSPGDFFFMQITLRLFFRSFSRILYVVLGGRRQVRP